MLNTGGNESIEECDMFAGTHERQLLHGEI